LALLELPNPTRVAIAFKVNVVFQSEILPVHIVEEDVVAPITPACSRRFSELMMW
jgi:hypothetical protein